MLTTFPLKPKDWDCNKLKWKHFNQPVHIPGKLLLLSTGLALIEENFVTFKFEKENKCGLFLFSDKTAGRGVCVAITQQTHCGQRRD